MLDLSTQVIVMLNHCTCPSGSKKVSDRSLHNFSHYIISKSCVAASSSGGGSPVGDGQTVS